MSVVQIPNLPAAISLTGAEELEIVQAGESKRTTSQAIANLAPDMTFPGYWASYYSTVCQTNPVGGAVNKVTFNNSTGNYGISVASNTQITVSNAGVYSIDFLGELQLHVEFFHHRFKFFIATVSVTKVDVCGWRCKLETFELAICTEAVADDVHESAYLS